ncbi:VPS10 domain-containing protein [Roseivirga thermotolerans]|uniref:VPS10 domain-containing protein n=1 Tax=Roseivirga thermotolerans TaxID=1758176 RepID=UPI00273D0AF2|nr:glycosyl hydrolase [Roseivirga thermotolerans]
MKKYLPYWLVLVVLTCSFSWYEAQAQRRNQKTESTAVQKDPSDGFSLNTLRFRSVGPALTSGRIADLAVNPDNPAEFYVAAAAGGVWKTTNAGTTFDPIFDNYGSYSIGALAMDPNNHNVIWVGTGENNNQRSVSYGDGIYKSIDGGASFKHMGLKKSEHIGMIAIDPRNSDVVYVAAYGPLWSPGGDRGLYKTTNGGETWEKVLEISEHTGVNEVHLDPRNPDVIYATAHQRRRRQWTYLGGGPESGIYKSTDAGKTWDKINRGLPGVDKGRIGMAISPANPEVLYAIVEAQNGQGGFYRSTNRGASWQKMSNHSTSGNYYQEIVADPVDVDRVYSLNTFTMVTVDGGKTFTQLGEKSKHWDNHAMWINPKNNKHILQGCDGGVYESFDQGENWKFFTNLPVTQFYKVSVDNAEPFYNIMGGTQDNYSLHGPSQTVSRHGIISSDWIVTQGGDGFESVPDPVEPNIVYAQSQNGGLIRFDRKSGESVTIVPRPEKGEKEYNFNWDSPLMVSPHDHKTIYFAGNKLFKSTDRGNSWEVISGELDQDIDRNLLPVMGKIWPMDAVAKNGSTSRYGAAVSLDESRLQQGLIYVGSDDGQISVTEDGGKNWFKINRFPGVPENTYVYDLIASKHDVNTVYAAFNNHKSGDFTPYVYVSNDKGRTWRSISSNLPEGAVYALEQDHVNANILFAGTEYGVHVSLNGGQSWKALKAGLPTINVRDMAIQERENDLVLGTFGRGFYVLDDYSILREFSEDIAEKQAHIFSISEAKMFNEWTPLGSLGSREHGFQGEMHYSAPNPQTGAIINYYLKEGTTTLRAERNRRESEAFKKGEAIPYPSLEEYKAEQNEAPSYLIFTIKDRAGEVVSELRSPLRKGLNQIVWDLTYMNFYSVNARQANPSSSLSSTGVFVVPGTYTVSMSQVLKGELSELVNNVPFRVSELNNRTLPAANWSAMAEFKKKAARLVAAMNATRSVLSEMGGELDVFRASAKAMPIQESLQLLKEIDELEKELEAINIAMNGDPNLGRLDMDGDYDMRQRAQSAAYDIYGSLSDVTGTSIKNYEIAADEFTPILTSVRALQSRMEAMHRKLGSRNSPWLAGALPNWSK